MDKVSKKEMRKNERMNRREGNEELKGKRVYACRGDTGSSDYYDNIGNCSATSW